jgi:hypothetical protein
MFNSKCLILLSETRFFFTKMRKRESKVPGPKFKVEE